jgi:hypothetical protein
MPVLRSLAVWLLIMALETVHGILRGNFLVPQVGEVLAARIGWPVGLIIVYATAIALARWAGTRATPHLLGLGAIWTLLTFAFEVGVGFLRSLDWPRILAEFNPAEGGLMGIGLLAMALCPLIAARLRRL